MKEKIFRKTLVRGTSNVIPIKVRKEDKTSFNLTGFGLYATIKKVKSDNDYEDKQAIRQINTVYITNGEYGEFEIRFTPEDTWIDEGVYYMDVMMKNETSGAVSRLLLFELEILGTPTNRLSQDDTISADGEQVLEPKRYDAYLYGATAVIVETPIISKPPENLVETLSAIPSYMMTCIDDKEMPARNFILENYGPRLSMHMILNEAYDDTIHSTFAFDNYGFKKVPQTVLNGGYLGIHRNTLTVHMQDEFRIRYFVAAHQNGKTYTVCGDCKTGEEIHLPENADLGTLNICLYNDELNVAVYITGNYSLPDSQGEPSNWMLKVELMDYNSGVGLG